MSKRYKVLMCVAALLLVAVSVAGTLLWVKQAGVPGESAFDELFSVVSTHALNDATEEELYLAAAHGVIDELDDDYADYYTAEEYDRMQKTKSGQYEGIGVTYTQSTNGDYVVVDVAEDGPAARAGIEPGDIFVAIGTTQVAGLEMDEISNLIDAQGDAEFTVELLRGDETYTVELHRESIVTKRVTYELLDHNVAYIAINAFYSDCQGEFKTALNQARSDGATALVLDLRGNLGGYLDEMMGVANCLMDDAVVLTVKNGDGTEEVYRAKGGSMDWPMAVLVNSETASASEALSGALQDYGIAVLVGTQTYGKGIVQTTYPLSISGGWVKFTTGAYYTPNGRSIHKVGLTPDIVVELEEGQKPSSSAEDDAQMQKALEYVLSQQAAD